MKPNEIFKNRVEIQRVYDNKDTHKTLAIFLVLVIINNHEIFRNSNPNTYKARTFVKNLLKLCNGDYIAVIDMTWKNGTIEKYKLMKDGSKRYY